MSVSTIVSLVFLGISLLASIGCVTILVMLFLKRTKSKRLRNVFDFVLTAIFISIFLCLVFARDHGTFYILRNLFLMFDKDFLLNTGFYYGYHPGMEKWAYFAVVVFGLGLLLCICSLIIYFVDKKKKRAINKYVRIGYEIGAFLLSLSFVLILFKFCCIRQLYFI